MQNMKYSYLNSHHINSLISYTTGDYKSENETVGEREKMSKESGELKRIYNTLLNWN
jgi:hypothetical protein